MQSVAAIQDRQARTSALSGVAESRVRAGDLAGALQAAATPGFEADRDELLPAIAEAQAESGDIEGSRRTAATIGEPVTRDRVRWQIALIRARAGDVGELLDPAGPTPAGPKPAPYDRLMRLLAAAEALIDELDDEKLERRRLLPVSGR
jgi:hypothetical protein